MTVRNASILIGGTMPASLVEELIEKAELDGAATGWNEGRLFESPANRREILILASEAAEDDRPLVLVSDCASNGRLDSLEAFCRRNELCYRRETDPDDGDMGVVSSWQPGMHAALDVAGDSDGDPHVRLADVSALLDVGDPDSVVAALRAFVEANTPVSPGPLVLTES